MANFYYRPPPFTHHPRKVFIVLLQSNELKWDWKKEREVDVDSQLMLQYN